MRKKLTLELEALAVDSFETSPGAGGRGTVQGQEVEPTPPVYAAPCTCYASCLCPSNAYYCATVRATAISCDYTYNGSCKYDTYTACGGDSINICAAGA